MKNKIDQLYQRKNQNLQPVHKFPQIQIANEHKINNEKSEKVLIDIPQLNVNQKSQKIK